MKKILFIVALCTFFGKVAAQENKLTKNGFYVESILGTAKFENLDPMFGGGLKLGNVWYFGSNDVWKPGVKTVWLRATTYFGEDNFMLQGSVANIGFANIFKFSEKLGLEANINFGYNVVYNSYDYEYYDYDYGYYYNDTDDIVSGGILINPEVKFRFNVLAVGLDFTFSSLKEFDDENNRNFGLSAVHLSFGAKF